jgi:site-specific DNA recombinase
VDVETAKQTGRASFGEMIARLRAEPAIGVLLVEKTDRLYRNLKDWVTVDLLEGARLLELARNTRRHFEKQEPR